MVQLPPSEFTFARYGIINLPWDILRSTESYINWLLSQNIIGFIDSMECDIRPRTDDMAVMLEEDGSQCWTHVPKDIWKVFVEKSNF